MANNAYAKHKSRLFWILSAFMVCMVLLVVQLFRWQIVESQELQRRALGQWTSSTVVSASRGSIYDRNMELLAVSASSKSLVVQPAQIAKKGDPNKTADQLAAILEMDRETIYNRVTNTKYAEQNIKRHLSEEEVLAIEALDLPGVVLVDDRKRYYPKGSTLAQVLGRTSVDGVGKEGLELKYDKYLRGLTGRIYSSTDIGGMQIPGGEERYIDPTNGLNLVLTIDYVIQKFAESAMKQCYEEQKAKKVECIVMNPQTGEVLAMVNIPDYDLNDPPLDDLDAWQEYSRNSTILDVYEPGSVFKIITLASALEEGKVNLNSTFNDVGYALVDGQKIKCWRNVPHGHQTLTEAVCNSCNPAFVEMGLSLGVDTFYKYLRSFGFGTETNIDFSADQAGLVLAQKYVQNVDLARMAFGQAIAVTPLQLITAVSAAINGGKLMQPYLVKGMVDDDGNSVMEVEPTVIRQVISEETSATVRQILEEVVRSGGGKNAYIPGYRVGGKTGTAQKYRDGVIVRDKHIASFLGFAPADDPQIAVLVVVDEPDVAIDFGSVVAAPYAKMILENALKYMNIQPENTEEDSELLVANIEVPDVRGMDTVEAEKVLKEAGLRMLVQGEGKVVAQVPAAGAMVYSNTEIMVTGEEPVDAYTDIYEEEE